MRDSADVVVVGGGILGCAVAAELARRRVKVVLVERGPIAAGASGRNHGLIFSPEASILQPIAARSVGVYRDIAGMTPLDLGLDPAPVGLVMVVSEEAQWAPAEREAAAIAGTGCAVERLDQAVLREVEPALSEGHLGGFLLWDGLRVDPAALTLALSYQATRAGADLSTFTEVKQVLTDNGRVRGVATDAGVVWAPKVVIAAGPWSAKLARTAQVDLPIGGARGWILLTEARPGLMHHLVESAGWHLAATDAGPGRLTLGGLASGSADRRDFGALVQQNRGGHILLGGSRAGSLTEEPEGADAVGEIARRAAALVPALAGSSVTSAWSGVRPTSPDGLPLIGWVPGVEGLFVAGGHGGQGVTLGAGSAILAAQLLLGEAPFADPSPFDPGRFRAAFPHSHE